MVEADERVRDDEAALREVGAGLRERDGRLQQRHVVVAEIAHDGPARRHLAFGGSEVDESCSCAHEAVPPQPALLDRLEQEARRSARAQAQVGAERRDQVGVDVGALVIANETTLLAGGRRAERAVRMPLG